MFRNSWKNVFHISCYLSCAAKSPIIPARIFQERCVLLPFWLNYYQLFSYYDFWTSNRCENSTRIQYRHTRLRTRRFGCQIVVSGALGSRTQVPRDSGVTTKGIPIILNFTKIKISMKSIRCYQTFMKIGFMIDCNHYGIWRLWPAWRACLRLLITQCVA